MLCEDVTVKHKYIDNASTRGWGQGKLPPRNIDYQLFYIMDNYEKIKIVEWGRGRYMYFNCCKIDTTGASIGDAL